jgi:hypothetical protein
MDLLALYPASFSFCHTHADGALLEYGMCDWINDAIAPQISHSGGQIYSFLHLPYRLKVIACLQYEEACVG